MSVVLPYPTHHHTSPHPHPYPLSRGSSPRPTTPLSAPPTPVTPTHLLPAAMERARSTEGVVSAAGAILAQREGRKRETKETGLKAEWEHLERSTSNGDERDDKMDVDGEGSDAGRSETTAKGHGVPLDVEPLVPVLELGEPVSVQKEELAQMEEAQAQIEAAQEELPMAAEPEPQTVWGMPKWGWEPQREEVRKGVRLVGMVELPGLVETHSLIDTPSSIMFPWLHGISDDGQKGRDMAAFFGYGPPFEPPPYRGLSIMFCPPQTLDESPPRPRTSRTDTQRTTLPPAAQSGAAAPAAAVPASPTTGTYDIPPRERSETMSTSSESYRSSGTTEGTSPSLGDLSPPPLGVQKLAPETEWLEVSPSSDALDVDIELDGDAGPGAEGEVDVDVAMHPCDSKRVSPEAHAKGIDEPHHPLPCAATDEAAAQPNSHQSSASSSSSDQSDEDEDEQRPSCILFNALHVHDVFDLPRRGDPAGKQPRFRPARLPQQINLRNLNVQQIKYSTVSDIILYAKGGMTKGLLDVAEKVAKAQETLYNERMHEFYRHVKDSRGPGEGLGEPLRYGVWVVVEPFTKLEKHCPHLVNIDSRGNGCLESLQTDLFEREARESRAMTRGSEVVEGFWVGNDCDVPGGMPDGTGAFVPFDLCLKASECAEMPSPKTLDIAARKLVELDRHRAATEEIQSTWTASPATLALRNLLSPVPSLTGTNDVPSKRTASPAPDERNLRARSSAPIEREYVALECSGSCRTVTGHTRNIEQMTSRVVELVYWLRKLVEGRDSSGRKRRVLVHCQDGYTESSIIVLAYIMASLSISLPEAFLHLQIEAKRSFFLYPSDKPLLRKIDARLAADRRSKAVKLVSATSVAPGAACPKEPEAGARASPRWKSWGMGFGGRREPQEAAKPAPGKSTVDVAKEMLEQQDNGGSQAARDAKVWFDDRRFDGFPSRILPFLYLGNLEHAGNAAMLQALGITHVVSVGESLMNPDELGSGYAPAHGNTLAAAARAGRISVLDLTDVRDDGNDPLRPVIARACAWIEQARLDGGTTLVHCRVGVSRSASIVIAYMMQYEHMGLMDAYMMCRARRLNVLIQPNLRFFHELFGWEVELARQEESAALARREAAVREGVRDEEALRLIEGEKRKITHSWPSFCRDLYCLNRRFLCN
ncbi:hypothetical protein IAT38_000777 [Cryptococcus sp. DSM 104549]